MRVFEALACGSLLVTNELSENGQAELFRDGVHLATYCEHTDLLDKLAFYLAREATREKIAAAGRAEAIARHTYGHRMEQILRTADGCFHFPWCDDFSAAPTSRCGMPAVIGCSGWIPTTRSRPNVRESSVIWSNATSTPGVLGFLMQVHCPGGREDGSPSTNVTVVDHVKLFRNRPDLRFDGRIHEQLLPAIRRPGGEVAWTDVYVVHSGSD